MKQVMAKMGMGGYLGTVFRVGLTTSFFAAGFFCSMSQGQSPHGPAFKIDCSACHVPDSWSAMRDPILFDHDTTDLPLEGRHATVDCRSCHSNMVFDEPVATECISCHSDVHAMTLGDDCARCHTPRSWLVDDIPELHEQNGFALVGVHSNVSCVDCHTADNTLAFVRVGNDCINCHIDEYRATLSPDHVGSGFSMDCIECHDPMGSGWGTEFTDHDFFPLTGGHAINDCARCHTTGNFADASPECVSCHLPDYQNTSDPRHELAGFSTDCAACHSTGPGWTASFDHDITDFPLHGSHETTACIECHANGYAGTPTACSACHMPEYNSTTDPNHATSGFSTDCAMCHDETAWGNATFDHNDTGFPLHGAHTTTACIECHANGYAGTPTACSACHIADYNGTNDPNHAASGFGTDCAQCHDESNWGNATFDHDDQFFPIYSGNHNGEWNACTDCHNNPADYSVFTCIDCHEHDDQNEVNNDHDEVSGYSYNSNACFNCHPNGSD